MKKLLFPIFIALFLVSVVAAQSVDTVLLASTENFADAELAKAASYNEGTPILLTEKDALSAETKSSLADLKPTTVVVVGGPAVISDAVVAELEAEGYVVVRVWGTTATGTAAELAEYSNPEGADSVVLVVEDSIDDPNSETGEVLAEVTAQTEGDPILLVSSDGVPAVTADALAGLGAEEVTVVGDLSAEAQTKLEADLGELKLRIKEKILGKKAEIRAKLKAKFEARLNASDTLLVIAAANFKHRLAAPVLVGHGVFHVGGEEAQIQEVVDLVNAKGIKEVKIVGSPELAAKIEAALKASTQATVDLHTGNVVKEVAGLVDEAKEKIKERFEERKEKLKERRDAAKAKIKEKATALWERLNNLENKPEGLQTVLDQAKVLIESDPHEALKVLKKAVHLVKKSNFEALKDKAEELREEIKKERENLKARVEALREFNQEFSDKLKDLSVEERLKTIKELHLLRVERVKAVVEAASGNETRVDKLRELRKEKTDKLKEKAEKLRQKISEKRENMDSGTNTKANVSTDVSADVSVDANVRADVNANV